MKEIDPLLSQLPSIGDVYVINQALAVVHSK